MDSMVRATMVDVEPGRVAGGYFARGGLIKRIAPFSTAGIAGVVALWVSGSVDGTLFFWAALTTAVLLLAVVALPWDQIPRWVHPLPALGYIGVIILLRQAGGGAGSGFAYLSILPLLWFSIYGNRVELFASIAGTLLVFAVPHLLGLEGYGDEWRPAILLVGLSLTMGLLIQGLLGEMKRGARALAAADRQFRAVFRRAPLGMATLDLDGAFLSVNPAICEFLGLPESELLGRRFTDLLHEEERASAQRRYRTVVKGETTTVRAECRYRHSSGGVLFALHNCTLIRNPDGSPSHVFLHVADVTRARVQARDLRRSSEISSKLAAAKTLLVHDGDPRQAVCRAVADVAEADVVAMVEPRGEVMELSAVLGGAFAGVRIEMSEEPSGAVEAYLSSRQIFVPNARRSKLVSKRLVEMGDVETVLFQPVLDAEDRCIGVLVMGWREPVAAIEEPVLEALGILARDAALAMARTDMLIELERLARTDPLTGLVNRRVIDEEIEKELGRATRSRHAVCVALLDLDHFKRFNDEHGHQAGDHVLKEAASAWLALLRDTDILGRYGGEEFVVLLPHSDLDDAIEVIQRLRMVRPQGLTFSAGIARWDGQEAGFDLLARADAALYAAKLGGRDRIESAEEVHGAHRRRHRHDPV